ncbi:MAG: OmpH family outer membrane protein [Alphaproteobacteria bacterium]|nr:OmpH family outer membrane protein [Alphaproteobacteria bacterium]
MSWLRFFLICAVFLSLNGQALAADSSAGKLPPAVVIIVDVQRILQESLAAKSVQKQLEMQRSKFQKQIESEENELRQAEQELGKSRKQVAADVYADREQQLRQRFLAVERHVQARRKVLDQAFTDSMNNVRATLLDIVNEIAQQRGANLALIKQQALWSGKDFDVTDEILGRLNKKLPQVTVKLPAEEAK